MPIKHYTDSEYLGSEFSDSGKKYPNPFFDLAKNYIPKNIKTLFSYCRTFFYTNSFIRNVVSKLTEYPITEIIVGGETTQAVRNKWRAYINGHLRLKSLLIEIGLDYYTYGNAFISAQLTQKRYLNCTQCKEASPIENVSYKLKNFNFVGTCPSCKSGGIVFIIEDEVIKSEKNLKFVRWSPEHIDIDYNPITNDAIYYYNMPSSVKAKVLKGNKHILNTIPEVFLESLRLKKKIEIDKDNFYHFKRPTLAEEDMGWGKPIILPALRSLYYLQTLKRGQEAIAVEHIVPKKAIYPANTTTLDPYTQMNLGKWRGKMEQQVKKWRNDPNHIGIFPIPIGYQELGGNARALMLTPEMKFLEEEVINSLGVPLEFVKGGATFTSGSVSLRIVENAFLNYRELLLDFMNSFVVPKIRQYLKYPEAELRFKKFKMADDIQAKQILMNLNTAGKVSDARMLEEFGFDFETEATEISKTLKFQRESIVQDAKAQARGQGEATIVGAQYQVRAQKAMELETLKVQAEMFQEELQQELQGIPEEPFMIIDKYATEISQMVPEEQMAFLQQLAQRMPTVATMVQSRMAQMQMAEMQAMQQMPPEMTGGAEQGAPQEQVAASPDQKQKGPTKGNV
jgi:hypothetical protein